MLQKFKLLTVNKQMLFIALFLIVINFVAVVFLNLESSRITRALTSIVVFTYFVFFLNCNCKWLYAVFILLVLTNISVVFYELKYGMLLYTTTSTIAYFILLLNALRQVEWKQVKWFEYFAYTLIFVFNLFTFNYMMEDVSSLFDEKWMFYMIKILGVTGITMCLISGFYNTTRLSFKSAYYMYASFGFVFSDFSALLAYYFEMFPQLFWLLDRGVFLFALYFLTRHAYMMKLEQESISS